MKIDQGVRIIEQNFCKNIYSNFLNKRSYYRHVNLCNLEIKQKTTYDKASFMKKLILINVLPQFYDNFMTQKNL